MLEVDYYADLACAWCLIGRYRLAHALARRPHLPVVLRWQPYQLHPALPPAGMDSATHQRLLHGTPARAQQVAALMRRTAAGDGVNLNLERVRRVPNTLAAHRLMRLATRLESGGAPDGAKPNGPADRLALAFLTAHLSHGRDIGDHATLLAIWRDQGLPPRPAAALLDSDQEARAVLLAGALARQRAIHTLPCLVFQGHYAVAGAQDADVLLPLLDLAPLPEMAVVAHR